MRSVSNGIIILYTVNTGINSRINSIRDSSGIPVDSHFYNGIPLGTLAMSKG